MIWSPSSREVGVEQGVGVLGEQRLDRVDRPGLDQHQRGGTGQPRRRDALQRRVGVHDQAVPGEPEDIDDLLVDRAGRVGEPIAAGLGQGAESRLELAAGREETGTRIPGRRCVAGLTGVPGLAPLDHPRGEGLALRVGGEEVFADPALADDDGVARRHGHDLRAGAGTRGRAGAATG